MASQIRVFRTKAELSHALVADILRAAGAVDSPNIALSGGSLLDLLNSDEFLSNEGADYSKWSIWFADERCVPSEDPQSNIGSAQRMYAGSSLAKEARWHDVRKEVPDASMDLVLLGMGPDGHCASLFPDTRSFEQSRESQGSIVEVHDSPKPPKDRVSMTSQYINRAPNRWFVVTGPEKADAVKRSAQLLDPALPAAHIKEPLWYLDAAAASRL